MPKWIAYVRSGIRVLALSAFVLLAGVVMLQDHLLYFPQKASQAEMIEPGLAAWPSTSDFRGVMAVPPTSALVRGTAIVFHGNAGHASHRRHYADVLTGFGVRVILAEYPGYGAREGKPNEERLVADAAQSISLAASSFPGPLLVIGESLGAGVAAAAVAQLHTTAKPHPFSLMLITPWDTLANVAAHHYPWLPVRWILGDAYDSANYLRHFAHPLFIVVSERDKIVPARFGVALYESDVGSRKLVTLHGAGHNDWPDRVDTDWWRDAMSFLWPPQT
jgi:uncharacterized protein